MKLALVFLNIGLFVFTCFVILTDGMPGEVIYILFALLLLIVPILNLVMILRSNSYDDWLSFHLKNIKSAEQKNIQMLPIITLLSNILLIVFSCWAFMSKYPHPKESGFIVYTLFVFLTPILSLIPILIRMSAWKSNRLIL